MYLVLYCHNIGMTDFSVLETEDLNIEEGYVVRGKWKNEQAFKDYLKKEYGEMHGIQVIDLIAKGVEAESYSQDDLVELSTL
ncbi:hypothetical protein L4C33_12640 [Vibrio makurazakiensis]|uniref:hypothetical protein n=1 Tax=Vibrio makurazakiensis TaxID=2910250 RepID=UPI003D0BE95A